MIVIIIKSILVAIAAIIVGINYFHSKEAKKMESKLNIPVPGSIHLIMSSQLVISIAFLFITTLVLIFF